ncbi:MAG: flagellar biosynthesis anti-sigma factor FlgM [Deltaproteobacteria bacterium]|nr:flagellar biosynthesis anti-sigma factor FlgM [Deltaproteobacteria bacterium]
MKVRSNIPTSQIQAPTDLGSRQAAAKPQADATPAAAAKVSLSADAGYISSLQAGATKMPNIRQDVVNEVREALNDGTFEQTVDMDAVVDGLMADL